jgi:uncharacterized protein YegL
MKIYQFFLLSVLFATPSCYILKPQNSYYNISTSGYKNIVFVLDVSGSMQDVDEPLSVKGIVVKKAKDGVITTLTRTPVIPNWIQPTVLKQANKQTTKLGSAIRALNPAINGLPETTKFSLLTFEDNVRRMRSQPISASVANKVEATAVLNAIIKAGGGTSANKALKEALQTPDVDAIFFLTDGEPTDATPDIILNEVRNRNYKHIPIHAIGLGVDSGAAFLKALAQQNGGSYHESKWF